MYTQARSPGFMVAAARFRPVSRFEASGAWFTSTVLHKWPDHPALRVVCINAARRGAMFNVTAVAWHVQLVMIASIKSQHRPTVLLPKLWYTTACTAVHRLQTMNVNPSFNSEYMAITRGAPQQYC
eukprot:GHRR01034015.1.p1 GENE.GHRR01034015.1~~GHRR01034015.1.p1  ORF type:complete len:126 (-),score=30.39 GHRR01034015.1:552-929(-)